MLFRCVLDPLGLIWPSELPIQGRPSVRVQDGLAHRLKSGAEVNKQCWGKELQKEEPKNTKSMFLRMGSCHYFLFCMLSDMIFVMMFHHLLWIYSFSLKEACTPSASRGTSFFPFPAPEDSVPVLLALSARCAETSCDAQGLMRRMEASGH